MAKANPLEGSLQAAVLRKLKAWRAADPTLVYRKRHGSLMGIVGDRDIYGVWRGLHFKIELKRPGENPTPLQRARLSEWGTAGVTTAVLRSIPELEAFFEVLRGKWRSWPNSD